MTHPERVATYLEHSNEAIDRACEYLGGVPNVNALRLDRKSRDAVSLNIVKNDLPPLKRQIAHLLAQQAE